MTYEYANMFADAPAEVSGCMCVCGILWFRFLFFLYIEILSDGPRELPDRCAGKCVCV